MAVMEKVYEGATWLYPGLSPLELGLKPGEVILIHPQTDSRPAEMESEKGRLAEVIEHG